MPEKSLQISVYRVYVEILQVDVRPIWGLYRGME